MIEAIKGIAHTSATATGYFVLFLLWMLAVKLMWFIVSDYLAIGRALKEIPFKIWREDVSWFEKVKFKLRIVIKFKLRIVIQSDATKLKFVCEETGETVTVKIDGR